MATKKRKKRKYNKEIYYFIVINNVDIINQVYDITIYFNIKIIPASRPRFNGFHTYIDEPYKSFKNKLTNIFNNIAYDLSIDKKTLINKVLSLSVYNFNKYNKSDSKKTINKKLYTYNIKKPDLDNIAKSIMDSTIGSICIDDSQYSNINIYKINSFDDFAIVNIKIFDKNDIIFTNF